MATVIHVSKKLEKSISKYIKFKEHEFTIFFGKWNATIFYVDRKKCWLITNAETKFSVIILNLKTPDIKNFSEIFTENFYSQLIYEGILVDFKDLKKWIGNVEILPTNNDRKTIGTQNYNIEVMMYYKHQFGSYQNMPFRDLTKRINSSPTSAFGWKSPNQMLIEKIDSFT